MTARRTGGPMIRSRMGLMRTALADAGYALAVVERTADRLAGTAEREQKIAYPLRQPEDDNWLKLHRIAAAADPDVRRSFLDAIAKLRAGIDVQAVSDALARGDIDQALSLIPFDDLTDALHAMQDALDGVRSKAFDLGRVGAEPHLDVAQLAIHLGARAELAISWRHVSSYVLTAIRDRAATRVTNVTAQTMSAIRQLLEREYTAGTHPLQMVKDLVSTIGLRTSQEAAVERYRLALAAAADVSPARAAQLVDRMRKKLLRQRAELIARTESLQAANDGQRASWETLVERGLLVESGPGAMEREWMAILPNDGRTCFPAGTSIRGVRGDVPIESVRIGAHVVTPDGARAVVATMARIYDGPVTLVLAGGRASLSTADHPYFTDRGWVEAGCLRSGDRCQSVENEPIEVCGVFNLGLVESDHGPTVRVEASIAASILRGIGVPIGAIDFDRNGTLGQREIDGQSADAIFLLECNPEAFERLAECALERAFAVKASVACERTEATRRRGRLSSKGGAACLAMDDDRRSATRLAAVGAPLPGFAGEELPAAPTFDLEELGESALDRAVSAPMLDRIEKPLLAPDAGEFAPRLANHALQHATRMLGLSRFESQIAPVSAKALVPLVPRGKLDAAADAEVGPRVDSSGDVVAAARTERPLRAKTTIERERLLALMARIVKRHGDFRLRAVRDWLLGNLIVYNITVEPNHVYFAAGILVHNCPVCESLDGARAPIRGSYGSVGLNGPPIHPDDRCTERLVPVKRSR